MKFAVMAHNTTYHTSIRCTPSEIFHGRVPYNSLALKFKKPAEPQIKSNKNITDQMKEKYQTVADNNAEAFHKYKAYYDRKAQAQPL